MFSLSIVEYNNNLNEYSGQVYIIIYQHFGPRYLRSASRSGYVIKNYGQLLRKVLIDISKETPFTSTPLTLIIILISLHLPTIHRYFILRIRYQIAYMLVCLNLFRRRIRLYSKICRV